MMTLPDVVLENAKADQQMVKVIEVTEAMIQAGRRAFDTFPVLDLADGWLSAEEVIRAVFVAMAQAAWPEESQDLRRAQELRRVLGDPRVRVQVPTGNEGEPAPPGGRTGC